MSFIRRYWFALCMGIFLACFACVFVIILMAPKQDIKKRGFIPCSENMIEELLDCNKNIWCSTKAIIHNNICVLNVIGLGIKNWINHEQAAPWSNYIFEPELYPEGFVDEEARKQYLAEHPNTKKEMEQLHLLRKDMEDENNEQSEFESNWQ